MEFDTAKLIGDDSSSDAEDIDIEKKNESRNQIWNTEKTHVQFIWCDHFFFQWENKTKYLGHDFQWAMFKIIASLE